MEPNDFVLLLILSGFLIKAQAPLMPLGRRIMHFVQLWLDYGGEVGLVSSAGIGIIFWKEW